MATTTAVTPASLRTPSAAAPPRAPQTSPVRELWARMGLPITGRTVPGTVPVAVVAGCLALLVASLVVPTGFNLAYSDAQSHLTIARRLFDTRSIPGLTQLGTVWLPVPHLLLAPLVVVLWLWHTGWGAALLGALCLAVTASCCYRIAARLGAGRAGRLITVAALVINPSLLYLTTTALTEPVLIACIAACCAGLTHFTTRRRLSSPGEVAIFCGIPAALAALSRYEGWALALTGTIFVGIVAWRRSGRRSQTVLSMLGFATPPALAIGWWVGFNWVVFHNPFEFFSGVYSANAQQAGIIADQTSTKGDLARSLGALNLAVTSSVGPALVVLAGLGLIAWLTQLRASNRVLLLVVTSSSYLFLIVALYTGQAIIWNPASGADYAWNNRFAMASIIPAALLAGALAEALPRLLGRLGTGPTGRLRSQLVSVVVVALVLAGQAAWLLQAPASRSLILTEAVVSAERTADSRQAGLWLQENYSGGGVLLDETTWSNAVLPQIGIPLREYYLRADNTLFDQALASPTDHVKWVWTSRAASDPVTSLSQGDQFQAAYHPVFSNDTIVIYRRNGG